VVPGGSVSNSTFPVKSLLYAYVHDRCPENPTSPDGLCVRFSPEFRTPSANLELPTFTRGVPIFYPFLLPRMGGQAFFIFMIIQFIQSIPTDPDEAALIDGYSKAGTFFRIILPQLKPAMITTALFAFYWAWEDFLTPLLYLNEPKLYSVSLALRTFADPSGQSDWGAIFAMSSLFLVPVFAILVVFQRYLVQGIATTGLKG
jgi:ABC-type anion transport system duplicated permease subunit